MFDCLVSISIFVFVCVYFYFWGCDFNFPDCMILILPMFNFYSMTNFTKLVQFLTPVIPHFVMPLFFDCSLVLCRGIWWYCSHNEFS